jgi:hypothetical protein
LVRCATWAAASKVFIDRGLSALPSGKPADGMITAWRLPLSAVGAASAGSGSLLILGLVIARAVNILR